MRDSDQETWEGFTQEVKVELEIKECSIIVVPNATLNFLALSPGKALLTRISYQNQNQNNKKLL